MNRQGEGQCTFQRRINDFKITKKCFEFGAPVLTRYELRREAKSNLTVISDLQKRQGKKVSSQCERPGILFLSEGAKTRDGKYGI